jgi:hypothetical protein
MIMRRVARKGIQANPMNATIGDAKVAKPGRRRILAGLGATGLAASAGVFGSGGTANAAPLLCSGGGCCNLAHCPPNTTWAYCNAHAWYIWYCDTGGTTMCACCETYNDAQSAVMCYR